MGRALNTNEPRSASVDPIPYDDKDSGSLDQSENHVSVASISMDSPQQQPQPAQYRLYKRRFLGLTGVVFLNIIGGMTYPWFGPIAIATAEEFNISFSRINWLNNSVQIGSIVTSILVPPLCAKLGLRYCFLLADVLLIASGWIRYVGTLPTLSTDAAYALLMIGQIISAGCQFVFLLLAPLFSETWFDHRGRTTATMIMSIANPFGAAVGQMISPSVGTPKHSILILAVICTASLPFALIVGDRPPTPPSLTASQKPPPMKMTLLALCGRLPKPSSLTNAPTDPRMAQLRKSYMTRQERLDFFLLFMTFGIMAGVTNAFSLLSNEILQPYGYSPNTAGFMGGALLLAGIIAALITAPIFDRVFTSKHSLLCKIFSPIVGVAWFSLIWAVRPNNTAALYAILIVIGACSISVLPIALELGVELTRNADTSAALLWANGSLVTIVLVLVAAPLRASSTANPPLNLHRLQILFGVLALTVVSGIFLIRGKQTRREMDENAARGSSGVQENKA